MYIKSIVLDGFKSYGNRVEVAGFDPAFNAITGLNGTGKSNILDSICFVLGIEKLKNVRAKSLSDLIYKCGQAGITKATVSVTFDNRDRNQCPIGYENHDEITVTRQVVMGGKNKYLINGINVQNKRVSDLFCSVQLNVNSPHFLIMQGHINQVLNKRPPELLSMVEEAAGTRMYETKKQGAQKIIERKDAKLRQLDDIIREDIAPKLQKLHDERSQYQEHQKVTRELENLERLYVAWKYVESENSVREAEAKMAEVQQNIINKKAVIQNNEEEAKDLDGRVVQLNRRLDEESGNALQQMEAEAEGVEREEASAEAAERAARDALAEHAARSRLLQGALADDRAALQLKRAELGQVSATFERLKSSSEAAEAALADAQQRFLAVSSGQESNAESLPEQLMAAKQEAAEASTRIAQSEMEVKHAEGRLNTLEREFQTSGSQHKRDQESIAKHQAQVNQLQAELSRMNFSEERFAQLQERARALRTAVRVRRDAVDAQAAHVQRCEFRYQMPEPSFDRTRVSGTVCKLIEVRDSKYCTALETAAGGRLYNVVVDTEVTSKLLLQRCHLETRTTIIPLNKISGRVIDRRTVRLAQEIGGGAEMVQLALDLVHFEERLRPAMEWVFGSTLVCRDMNTARGVTYHPRVRCRSVTLDGDVFDPEGTVSGGARAKGGSLLMKLQEIKRLEAELSEAEQQLNVCNRELDSMQRVAEKYTTLEQKLEVSSHELQLARARVAATAHAQLHAEIQTLREQVLEWKASLERDRAVQSEAARRARDLEAKVRDIKGHREREFKKADEALKKARKEAEERSGAWTRREQEFETLKLEVRELERAVASSTEQLAGSEETTATLQHALDVAKNRHAAASKAVTEVRGRIKQKTAEIASKNGDIAKLNQKKEQLLKNNSELDLSIKELNYKFKELQTELAQFTKRIRSLEQEYPWISAEREYFGAAGGLYDFAARDAAVAAQRIHQLRERKDKLARGLNARAHTLLAMEEEQYQDLLRKKNIVVGDRAKLVQVMADLDRQKKRTLVTAYEQVNRDFGSIFSTLLPGAQARLTPPPGLTVLDGLEVKVGFNNKWKESLNELSGGQRSLVALSFLLAMLLFKPAPLYILDEVDAALDLSHTQNIGNMLREHFKHSQFIIVSLKEGMFRNANVLFRTRYVDGMSSVERISNAP